MTIKCLKSALRDIQNYMERDWEGENVKLPSQMTWTQGEEAKGYGFRSLKIYWEWFDSKCGGRFFTQRDFGDYVVLNYHEINSLILELDQFSEKFVNDDSELFGHERKDSIELLEKLRIKQRKSLKK